MSHAIRSATLLGALLTTTACSTSLARVDHQWGSGPARAVQESPVILPEEDAVASLPLRVMPDATRYLGRCTVRGVWLNREGRERLLDVPKDSIPGPGFFTGPGVSVPRLDTLTVFTFQPGITQPVRVELLTPDFPASPDDDDPVSGRRVGVDPRAQAVDAGTEALLVQLWLSYDGDVQSCAQPRPPAVTDVNTYLLDFKDIYPAGSAGVRGGAWLIGVVALAALGGMIAGS